MYLLYKNGHQHTSQSMPHLPWEFFRTMLCPAKLHMSETQTRECADAHPCTIDDAANKILKALDTEKYQTDTEAV